MYFTGNDWYMLSFHIDFTECNNGMLHSYRSLVGQNYYVPYLQHIIFIFTNYIT